METEIVVDYREIKLIESLSELSVEIKTDNLLVGDIMIKKGTDTKCVIERKTFQDYVSSLIDGRLKNQSLRLEAGREQESYIIIYIIEGELPTPWEKDIKYRGGVTSSAVYSSLMGKMIRDNFYIFQTRTVKETAYVINKLKLKYEKETDIKEMKEHKYLETIKLEKKANMTKKSFYLLELSHIQGLSLTLAEKINEKYPSFCSLIRAYDQELNIKNRENMMCSIEGIGKILSRRIYEYLYDEVTQPSAPKLKISLKSNPEEIQ